MRGFHFIAFVACLISRLLSAAAPVTGEPELLAVLLDAQTAAESSFPSGRFRWRLLDERQENRVESHGTVTWSGEKTRWEYMYEQRDASGRRTLGQGREESLMQAIRTPRELVTYGPHLKTAVRVFDRSQSMSHLVDLLPPQAWFSTSVYTGRLWSVMLGVDRNQPMLESVSVEKLDADRVRVTHHHRGELPDYWCVCSLAAGANIIEYGHDSDGTDHPFTGSVERGTMEWRAVGDGRFSLVKRVHVNNCPQRPEHTYRIVLTIEDFDPSPKLPADYFTFEGLDVADGTVVTMRGTNQRKYVVGNPDSALDAAALEKLAEKLRTRGFGAAERH